MQWKIVEDENMEEERVTEEVDEGYLFETEEEVNLEAFNVPLKEWIA